MNHSELGSLAFRVLPWPLALLDSDGRLREANDAWRDPAKPHRPLFSRCPDVGDELTGSLRASEHEAGDRLADLVEGVLAGRRNDSEAQVSLGGSEYRLHLTAFPGPDAERMVLVALRPALRDERHQAIVAASPVGIALLDARGRTLEANPALRRLLGHDDSAPATPGVLEAMTDEERPRAAAALAALCSGAREGWVRETHLRRADGDDVPVRMHVSVSRAADDDPRVVLLVEDVSERTRLEQQLSQAQRIESVGRLAGGIAHDFNNLVTIIRGHTDLLLDDMPADHPLRPDLEDIRVAGERAGALTGQLLAFSRRNVLQPRALDLNSVVRGMEGLLRRTLGEDLELAVDLAPELGTVRADPGQMEQVLMNLVVNARDAMPRGGRLSIRTFDRVLDQAFVASHLGAAAGPHVAVEVQDTGHGMDEATLARIFEPFFTTKEPGKGTGLGLAMTYGIVKQSGGYIDVQSRPGQGTTISIYLPRVKAWRTSEPSASSAEIGGGGSETILVVEDEPALRQLTQRVLKTRGYTVLAAGSGAEAMLTARSHPGPVHLLLTDVVMPGMGGRELAERLQAEMPGVRVVYTSGYTDDDIVRRGVSEQHAAFLPKPFTPDQLVSSVRSALDG